ncbi:MAG: hypothetical protein ACRDZO_17235 [Egibacteraceae bacterium]
MDAKLIAMLSGRAFTLELGEADRGNLDVALANVSEGKGSFRSGWLRTEEGFHVRRHAIVALVIGEKQGEWAVARRP